MAIIQVARLTKIFKVQHKKPGLAGAVRALFLPKYEEKVAVNGISFSIDAGEMIGYIGLNGAGKSTTIKMLTGILVPTSGSLHLGCSPVLAFRPVSLQQHRVIDRLSVFLHLEVLTIRVSGRLRSLDRI